MYENTNVIGIKGKEFAKPYYALFGFQSLLRDNVNDKQQLKEYLSMININIDSDLSNMEDLILFLIDRKGNLFLIVNTSFQKLDTMTNIMQILNMNDISELLLVSRKFDLGRKFNEKKHNNIKKMEKK